MKKLKKSMAALLSAMMVSGIFTAVPLTAGAAEADQASQVGAIIIKLNADTVTIYVHDIDYEDYINIPFDDGICFMYGDSGYYVYQYGGFDASVTIPETYNGESVTGMGDGSHNVFYCNETFNDVYVTDVYLPASISSIGTFAFSGADELENIHIAQDSEYFKNDGAAVLTKDGKTLAVYPNGASGDDGVYEIPDGVTEIADYSFYYNNALTRVTVPDGVTKIGEGAFGDTVIRNISLPDTLTEIGDYAFYNCGNLEKIFIPESVTSIGSNAVSSGTKIIGYQGSAAETYANRNDLTFISVESIAAGATVFDYDSISVIGGGRRGFLNNVFWDVTDDTTNRMTKTSDEGHGVYEISYTDVYSYDEFYFKFHTDTTWDEIWGGIGSGNVSVENGVSTDLIMGNTSSLALDTTSVADKGELVDIKIVLDLSKFDEETCEGATTTVTVTKSASSASNATDSTVETTPTSPSKATESTDNTTATTLTSATESSETDFTTPTESTTEPTTVSALMLGDVNGDSGIDISDATDIQKFVAKITSLTETQQKAADVNGDGTIDISDATMIQKCVAKIITSFTAAK